MSNNSNSKYRSAFSTYSRTFGLLLVLLVPLLCYLLQPNWTLGIILAFNLAALTLFAFDKFIAGKGHQRMPEKLMFILALLGASPAILIGMITFKHKSSKLTFKLKFGFILVIQAVIFYFTYPYLIS